MTDIETTETNYFIDDAEEAEARALRDQTLAKLFRANEMVWLLREEFDPVGPIWRVDFLRPGPQGTWLYQRYAYDIPTSVAYFRGERAVDENELRTLRRQGKRFRRAR